MIISTFVLITTVTVFILYKLISFIYKRKKLPPGPIIWPFLGNIIEITLTNPKYPHLALAKMSQKYGPVMGFGFGVHYSVVISGYEEMKNIFNRAETCESRHQFPYVEDRNYGQNLGIIWASGQVWHDMRCFTIRTLRDFGFGKTKSMEIIMKDETDDMIEHIASSSQNNNGIWNVDSNYLSECTINVVWSLVGGYRFSHNDEQLGENVRLNDLVADAIGHNNMYNAFPFLRNWFPKFVQHDIHKQSYMHLQTFMKGLIDEIKVKRLERVDMKAQNFIEVFIDEIQKNNSNQVTNFTEEQLVILLMDLYLAGALTPSMILNWTILFLTLNPESQQKLQNEIVEVIPTLKNISLWDATKMPYMRAVMLEVSRLGNFLPVPPPRMATADIPFKNFIIPKGTSLGFNLVPVFADKEYWTDPEIFRPERFLNKSGEIIPQHAERIAIFGFGERKCLGEPLAWNSLIIFIAALFGNFTFESIKGSEPSAENPMCGITVRPKPYSVRVVRNRLAK